MLDEIKEKEWDDPFAGLPQHTRNKANSTTSVNLSDEEDNY